MPKLTLSVNKENENKNENLNTGKLSVTQKKINPDENYSSTSTRIDENSENIIQPVSIDSVEDMATWFIGTIGEKVFENVKNNEYLKLPYTENEQLNTNEWLAKALKTLFTKEQITEIAEHIKQAGNTSGKLQQQEKILENEKLAFDERMVKINARFEKMKEEVEDAEAEKHKILKELENSITLSNFVNVFFKKEYEDTQNMKRLRNLLNEAVEKADKNTAGFIAKFAKGWTILNVVLEQLIGDEKIDHLTVHTASIKFFAEISGSFISERRELIDNIADIISDNFKEYEFISPEQTLQLDPAIHNASGLGNASIKEGKSFAVIRKESRQAVIYADVEV